MIIVLIIIHSPSVALHLIDRHTHTYKYLQFNDECNIKSFAVRMSELF